MKLCMSLLLDPTSFTLSQQHPSRRLCDWRKREAFCGNRPLKEMNGSHGQYAIQSSQNPVLLPKQSCTCYLCSTACNDLTWEESALPGYQLQVSIQAKHQSWKSINSYSHWLRNLRGSINRQSMTIIPIYTDPK